MEKALNQWYLTLNVEEGAMSQGIWEVSRKWKDKETNPSLRASRKECSPANT